MVPDLGEPGWFRARVTRWGYYFRGGAGQGHRGGAWTGAGAEDGSSLPQGTCIRTLLSPGEPPSTGRRSILPSTDFISFLLLWGKAAHGEGVPLGPFTRTK